MSSYDTYDSDADPASTPKASKEISLVLGVLLIASAGCGYLTGHFGSATDNTLEVADVTDATLPEAAAAAIADFGVATAETLSAEATMRQYGVHLTEQSATVTAQASSYPYTSQRTGYCDPGARAQSNIEGHTEASCKALCDEEPNCNHVGIQFDGCGNGGCCWRTPTCNSFSGDGRVTTWDAPVGPPGFNNQRTGYCDPGARAQSNIEGHNRASCKALCDEEPNCNHVAIQFDGCGNGGCCWRTPTCNSFSGDGRVTTWDKITCTCNGGTAAVGAACTGGERCASCDAGRQLQGTQCVVPDVDCVELMLDNSFCETVGQDLYTLTTPASGNGRACAGSSTLCTQADIAEPPPPNSYNTASEGWCAQWTEGVAAGRGLGISYFPSDDLTREDCFALCDNAPGCTQATHESAGRWGNECWLGRGSNSAGGTGNSRGSAVAMGGQNHCYHPSR